MAELLPDVLTLPEGEGVALGEPEEEPLSEGEADSVVVAVTLGVFVPSRLPSAASKPVPVLDCVRERVADPVRLAVPVDEPDLVRVARDETETVPELVGEGDTLSLSEGALERVAPVRVEVPERETDADAVEEMESEAVALAEPVSDSEPDDVAEKLTELVSDGEPDGVVERLTEIDWRPGLAQFRAELDGEPFTAEVSRVADGFVIRHRAARARVRVLTPHTAELYARLPEKVAADTSKLIASPMPGLVVAIPVAVGQEVKAGETVAIIEAMKMQNILKAERDGVVKAVSAAAGDPVAADDVLVEFA